jgi:HlyD family secretion protein
MTLQTGNKNNQLRREPVAVDINLEFVSQRPGALVRWGNILLLSVLFLLCLICWFIRYPEIINAPARLTSLNAPKPVIAQVAGKLVKLNAGEDERVVDGQILGFIESTAKHEDVLALANAISLIDTDLNESTINQLEKFIRANALNLGELQSDYQAFLEAYVIFSDCLASGFNYRKREMLVRDKINLGKIHESLLEQEKLHVHDLSLAKENFRVNEQLNEKHVISDMEYRNEQSKYLAKQITVPRLVASIVENESQQNEIVKQILEIDNANAKQKIGFLQAINTFRSHIDHWKKKYVITAPITGKISFASLLQENQQIESNQTLCYVDPPNTEYFAEVVIPQNNLGKVKPGQSVILKLPSYPFQEYGSLNGKIGFISKVPTANGYVANIILGRRLSTTYQKDVHYREGLIANAEIVTRDMRLLERFYYNTLRQIVGEDN